MFSVANALNAVNRAEKKRGHFQVLSVFLLRVQSLYFPYKQAWLDVVCVKLIILGFAALFAFFSKQAF